MNSDPLTLPELMISAAPPEEVRVTDCVVGVFKSTLPNVTLVVLMVSAGLAESRLIVHVSTMLPAEALTMAVCAVLTADTVAVNPALVAPAGTLTDAGTLTALLLLLRLTVSPLYGAAPVSTTVHASVPAPVNEL